VTNKNIFRRFTWIGTFPPKKKQTSYNRWTWVWGLETSPNWMKKLKKECQKRNAAFTRWCIFISTMFSHACIMKFLAAIFSELRSFISSTYQTYIISFQLSGMVEDHLEFASVLSCFLRFKGRSLGHLLLGASCGWGRLEWNHTNLGGWPGLMSVVWLWFIHTCPKLNMETKQ